MNFAEKQNQLTGDGATRRCSAKFKNKEKCKILHVTEDQIKAAFIRMFNSIIENKDQIMNDCKELILELADTTLIEEKEIKLQSERSMLYNSMKELIEQVVHPRNAACDETEKIAYDDGRELPAQALRMDQVTYNEKYKNLKNQYDKINEKFSKIEALKCEIRIKKHKAEEFIENLK